MLARYRGIPRPPDRIEGKASVRLTTTAFASSQPKPAAQALPRSSETAAPGRHALPSGVIEDWVVVGVRGIRLEDPADVEEGVAAALAHDGPVLIDAVVSRTVLPIPPAITAEMAKGFTLYMVKAVFNGRGDDLVDLARSNLWA